MKTHAQVVVIGGGVVGCSVLYHLTKLGWKDVVLLERSELTSGSTWHAAGGMHTINSDPTVTKLQQYTINLYKEIEAISGQSCGIHLTGGVMLADTPERLDFLKRTQAKGRYLGNDCEIISLQEAHDLHPLFEPKYFVGAMFDPVEGHIDPSGVTNAYAKAARIGGAEVYRNTRVTALTPTSDAGWRVIAEHDNKHDNKHGNNIVEIKADIVVNAGGLWAREVGRMVGLELPVLAMEHHYLITETIPEIAARETELPHAIDFSGEIYTRQEQQGFLLGTYERNCVPWSPRNTPWDFGHELLEPDLERIGARLDTAFEHFPFLATAGIKNFINGPFTFAPDGNPLVGPVRGLNNFYLACAVMAGFSQGGGVGLALSNWIVNGDPGMDVFAMDVARFGDYATPKYAHARVRENYSMRFSIAFPNEVRPAGRPLRTTPVYDRLKAKGAVFGVGYGLESPLWYAPQGMEPVENLTFRRSNAFIPVAEECRAVRETVGIMEISGFAKYEITGPATESWLDQLLANRIPKPGRMALAPMLDENGKLRGDLTVTHYAPEHFYILGSGIYEGVHRRWFADRMPASGVQLRSLMHEWTGFAIAGPNARELLAKLSWQDVSNENFRFMQFRDLYLNMVPAKVGRVSFTGELGYEIWVTADYQLALYEALLAAGEGLGLRHFGSYALNSLRLEKSFGGWTREYTPDYTPAETGLERFVCFDKNGDFTGRTAALAERDQGSKRKLITLVVDVDDVDAIGDEPVFHNNEVIGWVTSGGYGHTVEKSIALALVPSELADADDFAIDILGDLRAARRHPEPLYDPQGQRMRS